MMANKQDLRQWLIDALHAHGGRSGIVDVCRTVWERHEDELRDSGPLYFTWQYDIRWAATNLRQAGVMRPAQVSPPGIWELA